MNLNIEAPYVLTISPCQSSLYLWLYCPFQGLKLPSVCWVFPNKCFTSKFTENTTTQHVSSSRHLTNGDHKNSKFKTELTHNLLQNYCLSLNPSQHPHNFLSHRFIWFALIFILYLKKFQLCGAWLLKLFGSIQLSQNTWSFNQFRPPAFFSWIISTAY